jgi:hypothetical protein
MFVGERAPYPEARVARHAPLPLLEVNGVARQVPVDDAITPNVEI